MDGTNPTSCHSPTGPVLRANPFPEVTDLICRLPLSTLFYRLEAVHLGDLLRISVRFGTKIKLPPSEFQGPDDEHTRRRRNRGVLRKQRPYLRLNRFQGVRSLSRKENSASGSIQRIRVRLRYRARHSQ